MPTSSNEQTEADPPSERVTHVYTKQHNVKGLHPSWVGPFKVLNRPTRSSLEIKVGLNRDESDRTELRAWADVKPAHRREGVEEAARPKRGRPSKKADESSGEQPSPVPDMQPSVELPQANQRPTRSTRNQAPNYVDALIESIDFSRPPPIMQKKAWQASPEDLQAINNSIAGVSRVAPHEQPKHHGMEPW